MIVARGGIFGGFSLYAKDGELKYCYNLRAHNVSARGTTIPAGKHQVRMEFAYDGGGLAKGGIVSLFIDGQKTGEGRVEITVPFAYSAR